MTIVRAMVREDVSGGLFTRDWAEAIYNMWLSSVCTDRYDPVPEFPCRQYVTRENCIHILYIHRTVTQYTPTLVPGTFYTLVLRGSGGCYHFYISACCMLFTLDNPLQSLYRPACLTGCSNFTCVYHQQAHSVFNLVLLIGWSKWTLAYKNMRVSWNN